MSVTAVLHGYSLEFDSFEDFEAWYADKEHLLPEQPDIYYEDDDGNEMVRQFSHGGWDDYHVIGGVAVSDEDWEFFINLPGVPDEEYGPGEEIGDFDEWMEIEDLHEWMGGEYITEE